MNIVRQSLLKEVFDTFRNLNLKTINCSPFLFSFTLFHSNEETNRLVINFEKEKLSYVLITNKRDVFYDEFFFSISRDFNYELEIKKYLNQINQYFSSNSIIKYGGKSDIYIIGNMNILETANIAVKNIFNFESINNIQKGIDDSLSSIQIIKKLMDNYDNVINFISENQQSETRYWIEKNVALRFLSMNISIVILLMLLSFYTNSNLDNISLHRGKSLIEFKTVTEKVKKIKKENANLKKNISILKELKINRIKESKLLEKIPTLLNDKTFLIYLQAKRVKDKTVIELVGRSISQKYIAEFIGQIENSVYFNKVSLLYSSLQDDSKLVQFKILADFDEL